jgi:hypothetical protein
MMLANARADLLGFSPVVAGSESADALLRRALMDASAYLLAQLECLLARLLRGL